MDKIRELLSGKYAVFWQVLFAGLTLFAIWILYENGIFGNIFGFIFSILFSIILFVVGLFPDFILEPVLEEYRKHGFFSAAFSFVLFSIFLILLPLTLLYELITRPIEFLNEIKNNAKSNYDSLGFFGKFCFYVALVFVSVIAAGGGGKFSDSNAPKYVLYFWGLIFLIMALRKVYVWLKK